MQNMYILDKFDVQKAFSISLTQFGDLQFYTCYGGLKSLSKTVLAKNIFLVCLEDGKESQKC